MATDIATLAIKVENGDVVKATTSLGGLEVAGDKAEKSATRLTRRMALLEIQAREMDAEFGKAAAEVGKLGATTERTARSMALMEIEARKMDAAMSTAKQAAFAASVRKSAEATAELEMRARKAATEVEGIGKQGTSIVSLRNAFAALGIGIAIREVSQLSDSYNNLRARLALVTEGTANLNAVQAALFQTAQRTRTSFEATADLYGRIARNAAGLGASQADILKVTEAVSKAMIISGNSADTSAAAIMQLGQAFASGKLQGDEFRSVMENAPILAQAIAKGMGVTVGELQKMSKEGTLTAEAVFNAIKKQGDALTTEFEKIPRTISGAMQQMRNEILKTLGGSGEMAGATGGIVTAIDAIKNAIGPTARVVNAFFGGFAIAAADAAIWVEKLRQKTAQWQAGIGLAIRATGNKTIGDALIGNAAKALKDGDDIIRMLEKQRDVTIQTVHAITEVGTVSTTAPTVKPKIDPNAIKEYTKLMDELRDATEGVARAQEDANAARLRTDAAAAANIQDELTQSEALLRAAQQGADAYKAQQREIEVLNALTRQGITLADQDYEAKRRAVEATLANKDAIEQINQAQKDAAEASRKAADEAQREVERRNRDIRRATVANIEGVLTDLANGRNPLIALAEGFKRALIRAASEALSERFLQSRFAGMLGIGVEGAAKKQDGAALKMLTAAKMQNDAADKMMRVAGVTIPGSDAPSSTVEPKMPSWVGPLIKATTVAVASGYAGYQTGQAVSSTSHGTAGNLVRGALGGAASGAAAGAAIGGLPGAIAGAVVGFVSGMFGASKAMKEAAKAAEEMRKALSINMAALRADVGKDSLAAAEAQVEAQREQLRKQIEDAYSGGDKNSATVKERNRQLAELNKLEDERLRQLREEAAVIQTRTKEDFQQRLDEATPGNERAEAIARYNREKDRELEDLKRSFGSEIDANEAATYAIAQQAIAAEKEKYARDQSTASLNAFTTAVKNAPTGFKLDPYIQEFAKGRPYPGTTPLNGLPVPVNPFVPPSSPMSPTMPSFSRTGTAATAPITFNVTVNESKTPQLTAQVVTRMVLSELDKERNAGQGLSGRRSVALDNIKLPPGGVPWRS